MQTFIFEVPRIKEEVVDILLDLINASWENIDNMLEFHAEKWRMNNKTTLYSIYYCMYDPEDEDIK